MNTDGKKSVRMKAEGKNIKNVRNKMSYYTSVLLETASCLRCGLHSGR
jgi:hypothetical protein